MRRRDITSVVLVVLAVVLGVYALVVDRGSITEGERHRRENHIFPAWRRDDVTSLALATSGPNGPNGPNGESIVLVRTRDEGGDGWRLESPRPGPADPAAVDQLLVLLETATVVRRVDAPSIEALDAPRVRGAIDMGKVRYGFVVGGEPPAPPDTTYLRIDGQSPVVVAREIVTELTKPADAYRDRTVVPYLSTNLVRFEVVGHFALERVDDVSFRLAGAGVRASRDALDGVWSALAEARAESFVDDAVAAEAVRGPTLVVRMAPKELHLPRAELVFGGACPGEPKGVVLVRTEPTRVAACVPIGAKEGLAIASVDLEDRHLVTARADEIEELALEAAPDAAGGDAVIDLARKGTGWHLRAPRDEELAPGGAEAASALAERIAKAEGVLAPAGTIDGPRIARVHLRRIAHDGDEIIDLFAPANAKNATARREADGARLMISPALARALVPSEALLRGPSLWSQGREAELVVGLASECNGVNQEVLRTSDGFSMTVPAGFTPDNASVVAAADALLRARAELWLGELGGNPQALASSPCRVVLTLKDTAHDAGLHVLAIEFGSATADAAKTSDGGGDVPSGLYARATEDGHATPDFIVSRALLEATTAILVDRHGFSADPASTRSVRLLGRTGGARTLDAADAGADQAEPAAARAALAMLQADRVVHFGPPSPLEGFGAPLLRIEIEPVHGPAHRIRVGAQAELGGVRGYYGRVSGVDATFLLEGESVAPLLHAVKEP